MDGTDADGVIATVAPEQMQLTTGRFVEPQEIADAVALLASPRSASTTGAEFVVDGGMLEISRDHAGRSRMPVILFSLRAEHLRCRPPRRPAPPAWSACGPARG